MSLALDFLSEYLASTGTTQVDYAKAAGIDPSLFSQIKTGDVTINGKNFPKLLRGLRDEPARLEFLNAHLRDQIPPDFAEKISVRITPSTKAPGFPADDSEVSLEAQVMTRFADLPSDKHRRRVIRFLKHLKGDHTLQALFVKTVDYLEQADAE